MEKLDCLPLYEDAEFYDLEFQNRSFDVDFYRRQAVEAAGPVLELACGTGRITLPIAESGVDVTGLDISPAMIERARAKAKSAGVQADFICADGRSYYLERKFKLIFAAANSLQHLHSTESVLAFLSTAKQHLTSNGRLIIDVFNPNLGKLARPYSEVYLHKEFADGEGRKIRVEAASEYLAASQILRFDLSYSRPPEPVFLKKNVTMRCFFPLELGLLCAQAGLSVERKLGNYEGEKFADDSPKQILILKSR